MGDPHAQAPVIHFAGTNGKGSCVATSDAILRARGLRVGSYTSPHLVDFGERIRVDGVPIADEAVAGWVNRWTPVVESVGATFFEATTAMAFDWFARQGVDVVVAETGLGGRLDATNVVTPAAAAVVSVGLEHVDLLGGTLEAVAAEKGGIFKSGSPAVIGRCPAAANAVLESCAAAAGAYPVISIERDYRVAEVTVSAAGTSMRLAHGGETALVRTPLMGPHQADNLTCTVATLRAAGAPFDVDLADLTGYLAGVSLPGRFQRHGRYVLDVAHNPDGVRVLLQTLALVAPERPISALVCVLRDKDWRTMLVELGRSVDHLVLALAPTAPSGRAWDLGEVARFAEDARLAAEIESDFDRALEVVADRGRTILITGSFHTVGDAVVRLQPSPLSG
jgi:dihydrofolate synthase / folylpolyglutamate synthase